MSSFPPLAPGRRRRSLTDRVPRRPDRSERVRRRLLAGIVALVVTAAIPAPVLASTDAATTAGTGSQMSLATGGTPRAIGAVCEGSPPKGFQDRERAGVHATAIDCIAAWGLGSGYSDGTFRPGKPVSRGQMSSFLDAVVTAAGGELGSDGGEFPDTVGSAHRSTIARLASAGVVRGFGDGRFRPDAPVSRSQMATFLVGTLDHLGVSTSGGATAPRFADVGVGTHDASVALASGMGLAGGFPDGTYRGRDAVTRGQMATFLARLVATLDQAGRPLRAPRPPSEPISPVPAAGPTPGLEPGRQGAAGRDAVAVSHGTELRRHLTGLPDGWTGRPSGAVTSTNDGQVIENLEVTVSGGAGIKVVHDDVVVRNNRVRHGNGANGVVVASGTEGVVVEYNEFDGRSEVLGNGGSIGAISDGHVLVRRNRFHNGRVGIQFNAGHSVASENWVEELVRANGSHGNGLSYHGHRTETGVRFERNRTSAGNSGGVSFYASKGPIRGSSVVDNLIVGDGLGFGLYGGRTHLEKGHADQNRDVRIEGNRFEGVFRWPAALGAGTNTGVDLRRPGSTFRDNRWTDEGPELHPRCGVRQDACE